MKTNQVGPVLVLSRLERLSPSHHDRVSEGMVLGRMADPVAEVTGECAASGGPPFPTLAKEGDSRTFEAVQVLDSEAKLLVRKVTPVVCEMSEAKDIDHLSGIDSGPFRSARPSTGMQKVPASPASGLNDPRLLD